ncbi:MAG: HPF/RaiA family ribosome-associated protein [Myxococcales bacterium]|nr:HPF/RaiA family ribosome-associated protein [Myxococcales bacterium]
MEIPTEITFHELPHSDAVELSIRRWIARLEPLNPRIRSCHVFVERPHRKHRNGDDFEIHVHLDIPGAAIAASRIHHEDVYVAVADAFRAVRRQLLEQNRMRTGHGRQQLSA